MLLVDSNIWCYYFDKGAKEHRKVVRYLESTIKKEVIAINTVVIMEVAHFLVKNLGSMGKEKMEMFLDLPLKVIDFDYMQALASVKILAENSRSGIGGRDATLLAAMKEANTDKIVTNDSAFRGIKGIKLINPVL